MGITDTWDGLMPGALVHRTQLSEVLLTDVHPDGAGSFVGGAQWPRRHPYYGPLDGSPVLVDVAIASETLRQATIAVFHQWLGVPLGYAFVMDALRVHVFEAIRTPAAPQNVQVIVELSDCVERRGMTSEAKSSVRMYLDGELVADGRGDARVLPPAVFRRLRTGATTTAQGSAAQWSPQTGAAPGYAVVERRGSDFQLLVDTNNPVYFDHPLDHIPGMVVLEGCRQVARLWLHDGVADIDAVTLAFEHHLELDAVTAVRVRPTGSATLAAEFLQDGVLCAAANFRVRDRSAPEPARTTVSTDFAASTGTGFLSR